MLQTNCFRNSDGADNVLDSLTDMMNALVTLFMDLGAFREADNIRQKTQFTNKLSVGVES